ncbi:PaaI HGG motif-containing thioesterase, possibly involved in aromatic compounds catabolism [Acidimicrobiia bacterium]
MSDKPFIEGVNPFGVGGGQWTEAEMRAVTREQHSARAAAGAVRRMIRALETTTASVDELDELVGVLDSITAGIETDPDQSTGEGDTSLSIRQAHRLRERSPFIGQANPVALPLEMEFLDGRIEAKVEFGTLFEGPPGCLHGGYIAGIFDEVLGAAQTFSGQAGMTGRLTVHYRSPTPLDTELTLKAELVSVSGRKILCKGSLWAGERLCAEAEGLFIAFSRERIAELMANPDAEADAG